MLFKWFVFTVLVSSFSVASGLAQEAKSSNLTPLKPAMRL